MLVLIILLIIAIIIPPLYFIFHSPFDYPYFVHEFDVSGKRKPEFDDYLDNFFISDRFNAVRMHEEKIKSWKEECRKKIEKSILKKHRENQYNNSLDDGSAYKFYFVRIQTRYRQVNYQRYPYKVKAYTEYFACGFERLNERYKQLEEIDFECTLRAYHSKNQRKLLTKELREIIIKRDNYTCQLSGKYMPDGVGLQIDHITPVSKGGKTVASNMRVLCSKCNGAKSNKIVV